MRSELGKMELDKTFEERDVLNTNIVTSINQAAEPWGIQVLRYEIVYPQIRLPLQPKIKLLDTFFSINRFFCAF
jgi:regulator of protease activity HflC (stomatin/prohibitin superfamily)